MDKRSKEALRRYKKSRQQAQSSSESSSSSESDSSESSYSSSDSERRRRKKARQAASGSARRSSSSSAAEERRKREKREHCQKKLEAKRMHLKRKLKEAKLKKRAAAAAAALSGHSHRALSPATQAKLKKLAERKHQRAASKERREREREKHRAAAREREREHHRGSRSPTKITKIRIHQDVKRQKSPPRMHHQLMSREKIIIQTRTRERTPSVERHRHEQHKLRQDEIARERERRERERERAEREAARDKERAEALARCQERQRERERLAREKLRREEEEKKYGSLSGGGERGERLLPRPAERDMAIAAARGYNSRERSLEAVERPRHLSKRDLEFYEREREYLEAERRGLLDREELRRQREYLAIRRRELSPVAVAEHYGTRMPRDPRDLYVEEDRERAYSRAYLDEARIAREREAWPRDIREREPLEIRDPRDIRDPREPRDPRDFRELDHEMIYPDERERIIRNRERVREEWKPDWEVAREPEWEETPPPVLGRGGFIGGPKRGAAHSGGAGPTGPPKVPPREQRAPSEPDWDADEVGNNAGPSGGKIDAQMSHDGASFGAITPQRETWQDHQHDGQREKNAQPRTEPAERRWQKDWHEEPDNGGPQRPGINSTPGAAAMQHVHHRSERGGRNFRRGGGAGSLEHGERGSQGGFRPHPPPLMTLPVQPPGSNFHGNKPRFPNKRNMTYTNPNLIKKQQAALAAAKAAAQASAVAAASTAVAAAKAAAQSAANATTNPGILGQVSGMRPHVGNAAAEEKSQIGEIASQQSENSNNRSELQTSVKTSADTIATTAANADQTVEKASGELSEISDSDDDILNKTDKKSNSKTDESSLDQTVKGDMAAEQPELGKSNENDTTCGTTEERADEEEILDFEEISDGELEEDARHKGVGDALGVDWASLIAETKRQAENANPSVSEQPTTAKQKWQAHRIFLDIGISMYMAGEEYAKKLLTESKLKLDEELGQIQNKAEVKDEIVSNADEDSQTNLDTDENTADTVEKKPKPMLTSQKPLEELDEATINVERLHPVACIQVAERVQRLERRKLIANACGTNSRALCARQDLKLRRQLCNLPAKECSFSRSIRSSGKLKAMALAAFQRAVEVK